MTRSDLFDQAWTSLMAHRLRTLLSALGIVCGIGAVVAALAIGAGARRQALDELGALGLDNIYVRAEKAETFVPLTVDDAEAVAARVGAIDGVAIVRSAAVDLREGARLRQVDLTGVSPSWTRVVGATVTSGRWLRDDDTRARRRVAVLGEALARELFGTRDPVGAYVAAADTWYRVVGVAAGAGRDSARAVFVPASAMDVKRGGGDTPRHVSEIVYHVRPGADLHVTASAIDARLRERYPAGTALRVVIPRALLDARLRAQRATQALLAGIGAVALIVSGIGIMNIMLASVVERTHEIGIRRAFGATRSQIVRQFTIEAAVLCVAGGVAGVPAGALAAWMAAAAGAWPVSISAASVAFALTLAVAVGLTAGIYPARRAASLDPVLALRAE